MRSLDKIQGPNKARKQLAAIAKEFQRVLSKSSHDFLVKKAKEFIKFKNN